MALGTDAECQKVKDTMRVLLPVLLNKSHDSYDKIRAILLYIFSTNGTLSCFAVYLKIYELHFKFYSRAQYFYLTGAVGRVWKKSCLSSVAFLPT